MTVLKNAKQHFGREQYMNVQKLCVHNTVHARCTRHGVHAYFTGDFIILLQRVKYVTSVHATTWIKHCVETGTLCEDQPTMWRPAHCVKTGPLREDWPTVKTDSLWRLGHCVKTGPLCEHRPYVSGSLKARHMCTVHIPEQETVTVFRRDSRSRSISAASSCIECDELHHQATETLILSRQLCNNIHDLDLNNFPDWFKPDSTTDANKRNSIWPALPSDCLTGNCFILNKHRRVNVNKTYTTQHHTDTSTTTLPDNPSVLWLVVGTVYCDDVTVLDFLTLVRGHIHLSDDVGAEKVREAVTGHLGRLKALGRHILAG